MHNAYGRNGVLVALVMHDIREYNLYEGTCMPGGKVRTSLWLNGVQRPKNVYVSYLLLLLVVSCKLSQKLNSAHVIFKSIFYFYKFYVIEHIIKLFFHFKCEVW